MSNLSFMEKLLDGVEVEWKTLGEATEYSTTRVNAAELDATSFVGVDNLVTGNLANISHLEGSREFTFVRHDVSQHMSVDGPLDAVFTSRPQRVQLTTCNWIRLHRVIQ